MRKLSSLAVTGGAGFIGANFIHFLFEKTEFTGKVVNIDKLTYAGNCDNLTAIAARYGGQRYFFVQQDIGNYEAIKQVLLEHQVDTIIHFAAESHVDRSIFGPRDFIQTNIVGTANLLEVAREIWGQRGDVLFHHVSTDEVYGSLNANGYFYENTPYAPRSPYSASKASSDHLVSAYFHTYGIPVTISNCSNNYGPYQFPEKLIPLMILNIKEEKPLPVYGDGQNIRDWLYVEDHNRAIWMIVQNGRSGETYNIGGDAEWKNIDLVHLLCRKVAGFLGKDEEHYRKLITYVKDRPGHDRRYAINCDKLKNELQWRQSIDFDRGLDRTIEWYLANNIWIERVRSGDYRSWISKNYENR